ncbi:MAG: ParA family protein, partial [Acidobacteria bacterium]
MSIPVIAFFNNKGGVGKTSLAYHLAWMYAELGLEVLAVDLDPQANLTAAFLDEERIEDLWPDEEIHRRTIYGCIEPLLRGVGDVLDRPHVEEVEERLHLLVGDLALARFEDELSQQWPLCLDGKERAFRIVSAFWRSIENAGRQAGATVALLDLGPNLGAINRASLIAADHVVIPLVPDLFS